MGGRGSGLVEAATVLSGLHSRVLGTIVNRVGKHGASLSNVNVYDVAQLGARQAGPR